MDRPEPGLEARGPLKVVEEGPGEVGLDGDVVDRDRVSEGGELALEVGDAGGVVDPTYARPIPWRDTQTGKESSAPRSLHINLIPPRKEE